MEKFASGFKAMVKKLPIAFTQNQRYDAQTKQVIRRICRNSCNGIDIGCHKGEVLDLILKYAPKGQHFGFEPIPQLFNELKEKYAEISNVTISPIALASERKESSFNLVVSNPSYSGLIKRKYDRTEEVDKLIRVQCDTLDNCLDNHKVDFIKVDVEGGELGVFQGARKTILKNKPVIIFEHGLGASDYYGTTPENLYLLLTGYGMQISLMNNWLKDKPSLTKDGFKQQFYQRKNYYFIAYFR